MSSGSEYEEVEKPLLDQLTELNWSTLEGDKWDPSITERESFRESILEARLRKALVKLNPGPDGKPWLDDARISEAVSSLTQARCSEAPRNQ